MLRPLRSLWCLVRLLFMVTACVSALGLLLIGGTFLQIQERIGGSAVLPADCAIVFGAAVYGSVHPGPAIVRRVSTAATLYRTHLVRTLILSGGRGEGNSLSEAQVMRQEAVRQGVRGRDMLIEDTSHSTWDNLFHSKNLTSNCKSVVGISDGYHLARIELIARRQGWTAFGTVAASSRPDPDRERKSMYREVFGYLYYALYLDHWITSAQLQEKFRDFPEKRFLPGSSPKTALAPVQLLT